MKISNENLEKVVELLQKKNIAMNCKECSTGKCSISTNEYHIMSYDRTEKNLALNKAYYYEPMLTIQCGNCGSIRYFNLITLLGSDSLLK